MVQGKRDIIANIGRLNQIMDRDGYAALVLRSGKNFTYLAGFAYPGTLGRHLDFPDSPRGVLVVWPRSGEPVMVLNPTAAPLAERDSWLSRVEIYGSYAESPFAKAAGVLKGMGIAEEKIGFEKSYISAADWEEIPKLLPRAELSDCTAMMDEVRWIKTPGEVALIREAADILDEAYIEAFTSLRPGETEREIHSRIVAGCIRRGAQWTHGMLNPLRNTVLYGGESGFPFEEGDVIRNDYVSYYLGYPGHQSRVVVLGKPTSEQKRIYRVVLDIYRAVTGRCRPGARAGDLYDFASGAFRQKGYKARLNIVGHSVGAWWHQQEPHMVPGCDTRLETGMVIALEPHADFWHIQDMVLITEKEPELLTPRIPTDEMFVAG